MIGAVNIHVDVYEICCVWVFAYTCIIRFGEDIRPLLHELYSISTRVKTGFTRDNKRVIHGLYTSYLPSVLYGTVRNILVYRWSKSMPCNESKISPSLLVYLSCKYRRKWPAAARICYIRKKELCQDFFMNKSSTADHHLTCRFYAMIFKYVTSWKTLKLNFSGLCIFSTLNLDLWYLTSF